MKIAQSPDLRAQLTQDQKPGETLSKEEREKLSAQFEALLVHELVKSMRATVDSGDSDFGVSMSMDMMDQSLSDAVAGQMGIGKHLLAQIDPETRKTITPAKNVMPVRPPLAEPSPAPSKAALPSLDQITPIHARPVDALPVDGIISSPFGERIHPITGKTKEHHGIDIAASKGQEIYAVRSGVVRFAGDKGGYGKTVEIKHQDGTVSRYAHADKIHVRVGDRIEAGECIADVGSTGHSTGPHLHFEIHKFGKPIDPTTYLKSP